MDFHENFVQVRTLVVRVIGHTQATEVTIPLAKKKKLCITPSLHVEILHTYYE